MIHEKGRRPSHHQSAVRWVLLWLVVQHCTAEEWIISKLTRQGTPVGLRFDWPSSNPALQLGTPGSGSSGWRLLDPASLCPKVAQLLPSLPPDCLSFDTLGNPAAETCGATLSSLDDSHQENVSFCEANSRTPPLPPLRTAVVLPAPLDPVLEAALSSCGSHAPLKEKSSSARDEEPSLVGLWFADGLGVNGETAAVCSTSDASRNLAVKEVLRELRGEGAHRQLVTRVRFEESSGSTQKEGASIVALVQELPSGVYADKFEVHRMAMEAAASVASIYGPVDIERPAPECTQSLVVAYAPLSRTTSGPLETTFTLALHARYPAVMEVHEGAQQSEQTQTHTTVRIGPPLSVLWSDSINLSTEHELRMHDSWHHALWTEGLGDGLDVRWEVPHGKREHADLVRAGTASACLAGTLYVLRVVFKTKA